MTTDPSTSTSAERNRRVIPACPTCKASAFVFLCACMDLPMPHYTCDACDLAFGVTEAGVPCSPYKGVAL